MITTYTIENCIKLFKKYGLDVVQLQAETLEEKPAYYMGLVDWIGKVLAGVAPGTGELEYIHKAELLTYFLRYCEDVGQIKQIGRNIGHVGKEGGVSINELLVDGIRPVLTNPPLHEGPTSLHISPDQRPLPRHPDHEQIVKELKGAVRRHKDGFTELGNAAKEAAIAVDTMGGTLDKMSVYRTSDKVLRVWGFFRWVTLPVDLKIYGAVCKLQVENDEGQTRYVYRVEEKPIAGHEVKVNMFGTDVLPYRAAKKLKKLVLQELSY